MQFFSATDAMAMISYRHEALNDYNECHKHYSVTMPAIDLIASLIAPTATLAPDAHRCDEHFAWKDADTIHINYIDMPSPNVIGTLVDNFAYSYLHPTAHKDSVWFRHGDHLGSTSWVTNAQGTAVQHVVYMPYGYIFNTWQASTYNDQLKYTGKERDAETNYDYFGARYYAGGPNAHADPGAPTYNPNIGPFWLSVDPLADQYPDISPYAYCAWNPMKYVDPNGMWFDEANEAYAQEIEKKIYNRLQSGKSLSDEMRVELHTSLDDIQKMREDTYIEYRYDNYGNNNDEAETITSKDNPEVIIMYVNEQGYGNIIHETRHGGQVARRQLFYDSFNNYDGYQRYDSQIEISAYRAQLAYDEIIIYRAVIPQLGLSYDLNQRNMGGISIE